MPIYAFECTACKHAFDRLQKLSDPDPTDCPECGKATLRRQLTAPSFRLAGSGWYETDFKKDGDRKRNLADSGEPAKADAAAKGDGPAKGDGAAKGDGKSESAAPAKTDSKPASSDSKPAAKSEVKPAASGEGKSGATPAV